MTLFQHLRRHLFAVMSTGALLVLALGGFAIYTLDQWQAHHPLVVRIADHYIDGNDPTVLLLVPGRTRSIRRRIDPTTYDSISSTVSVAGDSARVLLRQGFRQEQIIVGPYYHHP